MKRLPLVCMLCFLTMSCAAIQRTAIYNTEEYLPYMIPGKATITGQAFATTKGGEIRYAAGRTISLHPATTYATEYFHIQVVQGRPMSDPDQRFLSYEKETVSDAAGNFEFINLPEGKYYVVADFSWCVGKNPQYIILGALTEAKDGVVTKVIPRVVRSEIYRHEKDKRVSCY
jgi:hypothetical protein